MLIITFTEADENTEEPASPTAKLSDRPLWQAWVCEEVFREVHHFAPWHPDEAKDETEDDCEDPERMVLFDDISQVLFRLGSQQKQFQLICHFLEFLGVSVPRCLIGSVGKGSDTTQLYSDQPSQIFTPINSCCTVSITCKSSSAYAGIASNCMSLEHITNRLEGTEISSFEDACVENRALEDFVEEIFNQITPVFQDKACTQLLSLRLDFRMRRALIAKDSKQQRKQLKEAKRFAKRLLSQEENRNNLDLWAALARWEQTLGNFKEAQHVLQTALVFLGQPQTEKDKQAATRLVQTFTELFIQFDSKTLSPVMGGESLNISNMEVLHVLTTLGEGMVFSSLKDIAGKCVSSTRLLKARRNYQEMTTEVLASNSRKMNDSQDIDGVERGEWLHPSGSHVVSLTKCFAFFQYLTVGMQAASVVFETSPIDHQENIPHQYFK